MTVLDRMLNAGITRHTAERHIRCGRVRVDGVPTTDPTTPADPPARVVLWTGEGVEIDPIPTPGAAA